VVTQGSHGLALSPIHAIDKPGKPGKFPNFFLSEFSGFSGSVTYHLDPKPIQESDSRPAGPSNQNSKADFTFMRVYALLLTLLATPLDQSKI
jgi:hypothetical protein